MGDPTISDLRERLARIEEIQRTMQERQSYILSIVEKQASELGEWVERISLRVNALEHIWAKILGAATVIGIVFSFIFDWFKNRLTS
jgi:hypothetical protein